MTPVPLITWTRHIILLLKSLIDFHAIDDRVTPSAQTLRSSTFRSDAMVRDGPACVFTFTEGSLCEAAHLLPKSKGDEYIEFVLQDLQHLYDLNKEFVDLGVDSVENGTFLSPGWHKIIGAGSSAFLKTPNFALQPADIRPIK
ncbi:hypothetical protein K443DRAFT_9872 [Laccaria amethystina LaAM-08-1]|uniref:HNH nuclease domain-containing protein n=1 Tax=Laccaria amethystina LaAM-08-1 TaxID=1095629 RepID=A0A0C9WLQ2_9AGAR|nr:hypothetical protein K443DRAFT_9872 [Laccaria amethystina LaAM-08-1]